MSSDPSQQPGSEQGPYYEYNTPNPYSTPNPYAEPQIPYEAAYAPYGAPNQVPPATPLPLGQAIGELPSQYWRALSKPGAATYAQEAVKAKWDIIWVQLIGLAIIAAILAVGNAAISATSNAALMQQLNGNGASNVNTAAFNSPRVTLFTSLAGSLIGFFIGQGILFGLAKAFGGQGTFTQQGYVFLLFQVPLGILEGLFRLLPVLGGLIALVGVIYEIVLSVFAIQGVHRLSGGKASAVVLIPIGVALLLLCAVIVLVVVAIANHPNVR